MAIVYLSNRKFQKALKVFKEKLGRALMELDWTVFLRKQKHTYWRKYFASNDFFATRRVVDVDDLENQSFERNGDFKKSVFSKFQ